MTPEQYAEWKNLVGKHNAELMRSISIVKANIQDNEDKLKASEEHKRYLIAKDQLLSKENLVLKEQWSKMRMEAKDTYANIYAQLLECQNLFFDIRLGDLAKKKGKTMEFEKVTALVDLSAPIPKDCKIQAVQLYTSKTPSTQLARFYVAVFAKLGANQYSIKDITAPLFIQQGGLNTSYFINNPLSANQGDYIGLVLTRGCPIDFDELDLASMQTVGLSSFTGQRNATPILIRPPEHRDLSQKPGSTNYAFSVLGTSDTKYIFLFDNKNHISQNGILKKLAVNYTNLSKNDMPQSFYLGLFRPDPQREYYSLVALSDRMTMLETGKKQFDVFNSEHKAIYGMRGDIYALILSPGIHLKNVSFPKEKYKTGEFIFNPVNQTLKVRIPVDYDTPNPQEVKECSFDSTLF